MTAVERGGYAGGYMPPVGQLSVPWSELDALHQRIGRHFARSEPRLRALRYIRGLLASPDRKNGRRLADFAQEQRPDGMQRLLTRASWSAEAVRDELQDYVMERMGQESATLALVETVFERRGSAAAGAGHHYSPAAGRFVNSQLGAFLGYVVPGEAVPFIDRRLYVPPPNHALPDPTVRRTRSTSSVKMGALAQDMVARSRRRGLPWEWLSGSNGFGVDREFRGWLDEEGVPYVLSVPMALQSLSRQDRESVARRISDLMAWRDDRWYRPSQARGTVDLFSAEWASVPLDHGPRGGKTRLLLLRRAKGLRKLACYICLATLDTPLPTLVSVAEAESRAEGSLQLARRWAGLDQYQVRGEQGWYRHTTLAMVAHAFLATTGFEHGDIAVPLEPNRLAPVSRPLQSMI